MIYKAKSLADTFDILVKPAWTVEFWANQPKHLYTVISLFRIFLSIYPR
jgi:hypothetical protein